MMKVPPRIRLRIGSRSGRTLFVGAVLSLALHGAVLAWAERFWEPAPPKPPAVMMAVTMVSAPAMAPPAPRAKPDTIKQLRRVTPIQPKPSTARAAAKPAPKIADSREQKAPQKTAALPLKKAAQKPPLRPKKLSEKKAPAPKVQLRLAALNSPHKGIDQAQKPRPAIIAKDARPPRYAGPGIANPAPDYPWLSRRYGEQGAVLVHVRVTDEGRVERISVKKSSGHERLDQAALKAVRSWRFTPAQFAGRAQAGRVDVPVIFRLTN